LLGDANADLSSIKRVWLLLDRESVSSVMEGKTESSLGGLFTAVIQYRSAPDLEQLAIAASKEIAKVESLGDEDDGEIGESSSNAVDQPELQLVAESISETHVAIGSSLMVGKMKNAQKRIENSELSRLLTQIEFSSDVEGVIATGPIRDTLRSLFAMAAQFGGK